MLRMRRLAVRHKLSEGSPRVQGTLALGRTDFSAAVWQASKPKRAEIAA